MFILFCLLLQAQLFANTVIVKGYVKDSANHAVANRTVKIYSTDSTSNGCLLSHTTVTNANGYYIDTLTCNGDIRKLAIIVENCNGVKIIHDLSVTPNNIIESNFIICEAHPTTTIPLSCKAAFSYTSNASGVKFNGAGSSTVSGDSIISRTWKFGDSSALLTGNIVDPSHAYTKPGVYTACLSIKTKRGCESSYCQTVVFTPASNDCNVQIQIAVEKLGAKKFRFNNLKSSTLVGDSIVQRIWKFGDASSLDGNQVNPAKEYKDTGVYNVCLSVRTAKGCEKQTCIIIVVRDSVAGIQPVPTNCKAVFTYTYKDSTVYFNSNGSTATSSEDSIISRKWYYAGTSTSVSLSGNEISPSYKYTQPGTYQVYLVIKTKKGCESKYSAQVVIPAHVVHANCKAVFTYTYKDSTVYFNSNGSTATSSEDSIISRKWYYAGTSTSVSLSGNEISPSYKYTQPGTYTVYLVIKTKKGCESKYSTQVVIPGPAPLTGCKAYFTYTNKDSVFHFSSANSKASSDHDSIISRTWYYIDSANGSRLITLTGNIVDTSYTYTKPGSYNVYLLIKTKNGCESRYSATIVIAPKPTTNCKAVFTYTVEKGVAKFNSAPSKAVSNTDSIISRTWLFGDSTAAMQGNIVDPSHSYAKSGKYTIYLYIKTKSGCESKYAETVTITTVNCPVDVKFSTERISLKKIQFNSNLSAAQEGDSIIQRNWKFGDNTVLSGNEIKTVKEFSLLGAYTTCLQIRTLNGCEARECKQILIQDTITTPQSTVEYVKIISINPNPVVTRMITTIFSRNSDVEAEISIYDVYGTRKLSIKKVLAKGNNMIEIATEFLYHGPYYLKVSTKNGMDTKAFYKL